MLKVYLQMNTKLMTEQFTIELADNGMTVKAEDYFEVFENTHTINSNIKDNVYFQLGKLLYSTIKQGMDELVENKVKMKIEITK